MGTRGYYCYRFRGRLYVYYNHWDSYPAVLGSFLIENIPTDPEEYQGSTWRNHIHRYFSDQYHRMALEITCTFYAARTDSRREGVDPT